MLPSAPPQIPANELRPGRYWYAVAAGTAVVLVVLGVVLGIYRFNNLVDAVDTGHRFTNGDTVSLRLGPESEKTIWIKDRGPSAAQDCSITGPGDPHLGGPGIDVFLTRDETWNPLYDIDVSRTGDYEITCSSEGPSQYAIGKSGGIVSFLGGSILVVVLPLTGVGLGAAIVIVTAVRRRDHRKRLLAERGGPGWGHPAQPGPATVPAGREGGPLVRRCGHAESVPPACSPHARGQE
ncbi:hypothetical protein ABZ565_12530 [Streptomyces sp. NPDC016469]|uniref:hypothetical protein n=1 Tax=Streptomyces sp. NPDC016469 TaxID=3157191 RepID=UPI0033F2FDB6